MIEVERLLEAVPGEAPCGANLEYDAAFMELEQLARGKPEQQIGDSVQEAEPPDWKKVQGNASDLLQNSKDLRIAIHLTKALLNNAGFEGLAQGTSVVRGLIDQYWDGLHPELDPDDDNDPTMRINILMELCDADGVLAAIRTSPLVEVRGLGRYSLRDVLIASGELEPSGGDDQEQATQSSIDAAFTAVEIEALQSTHDAIEKAHEDVTHVEQKLTETLGAGNSPSFATLSALLAQTLKVVKDRLLQRGVGVEETTDGTEEEGGEGAAGGAAQRIAGEVRSREDVARAIDKICDYYDRFEPSSPIPLMLRRCQRLVHMNFLDIVRDVAPEGFDQATALQGRIEEED